MSTAVAANVSGTDTPGDPKHIDYVLHLADTTLVLGQRNAQWCAQAPSLEEDIALANLSLDQIGQARLLYQHAAQMLGGDATEDTLAYFRDAPAFRNWVIAELPHHTGLAPLLTAEPDFAFTIVRNYLVSSFMALAWQALLSSRDTQLAAIAERSVKEARYHVQHSRDWLIRLGDGTAFSHARAQAALNDLMPFTQEFWASSADEVALVSQGLAADTARLRGTWESQLAAVVAEATLQPASAEGHLWLGKRGHHTEHLGYVLAEMQSLARAHPGARW